MLLITYGTGHGSRLLARRNALADAGITEARISKKLGDKIRACKIVESKAQAAKLKGEFTGLLLQKCAKSEVALCLAFGFTDKELLLAGAKAAGIRKAEKAAFYSVKKLAEKYKLKLLSIQHFAVCAEYKKEKHSCAVLATILK